MQAAGIPTEAPPDLMTLPHIDPDTLRPDSSAQHAKPPASRAADRPRGRPPSKSDSSSTDTDADEDMADEDQEEAGDSVTEQKLREGEACRDALLGLHKSWRIC